MCDSVRLLYLLTCFTYLLTYLLTWLDLLTYLLLRQAVFIDW